MSEQQTFRVIFNGDLLDGYTPADVRQRLGEDLNLSSAMLDKLFSGQSVTLKKGASCAACEAVVKKFSAAGARCQLVAEQTAVAPPAAFRSEPPPLPPPIPEPAVRRVDERYCESCGAAIKLNVLACPYCGHRQKTSRGMPGCAVAAIVVAVCFGGISILGILAAIAIPNFIAYRNKAMIAQVQQSLKDLASAQALYHYDNKHYADSLEMLGFSPVSDQFQIDIQQADADCFLATGTTDRMENLYWIDCNNQTGEQPKKPEP